MRADPERKIFLSLNICLLYRENERERSLHPKIGEKDPINMCQFLLF